MDTTTEHDPTPDPTPVAPPDPTPAATGHAHTGRWLLAFVLIGLLLRLPLLGDSIWFDEACMSRQRIGTLEQLLSTIYVDIHPPLFITFMHLWNAAFGDGEWSMRTPALLAGLLSIPLLYLCGRRLVGHTGALWAAGLLAISPAHIWYSAEARLYAPLVLCSLFAVYTFDRLLVGNERRRWLWFAHVANIAVMLALHYYLSLYVVLLAGMAPLVARGFSRNALRILLWHGIGILLLGVFVYAKQQLGELETSQGYLRALTPQDLRNLLLDWCWTGHCLQSLGLHESLTIWLPQGLAVVLLGLGLIQILNRQEEHRLGVYVPVFALVIPGFLILSAWLEYGGTYIERTCLPTLPFLLLLVGAGIAGLPGRRTPQIVGGVAALVLTTAVVAMFWHRSDRWTVYKPNPDWRAAATWLGSEIDAGGAGRPVFTSMPNPRPLPYYDVRIQDEKTLLPSTTPGEIQRKVERRLGPWFGRLAGETYERLAAQNRALLEGAKLRVYRSASDPGQLELPTRMREGDDVCYLVRNEWQPSVQVDGTIEDLLKHPKVTVLEQQKFPGMSAYKVRIAP